jgi:hypothetical protein
MAVGLAIFAWNGKSCFPESRNPGGKPETRHLARIEDRRNIDAVRQAGMVCSNP